MRVVLHFYILTVMLGCLGGYALHLRTMVRHLEMDTALGMLTRSGMARRWRIRRQSFGRSLYTWVLQLWT